MVSSCKAIVQYHNQDINVNMNQSTKFYSDILSHWYPISCEGCVCVYVSLYTIEILI